MQYNRPTLCAMDPPQGFLPRTRLPGEVRSWVRKIPWRRKWQPTSVFLPGKSQGQRSLVDYSPLCHKRVRHDWAHTDRSPESSGAGQRVRRDGGVSWVGTDAWNMHKCACMDQKLADFLQWTCICVCDRQSQTHRFNTNLLTCLFKPVRPWAFGAKNNTYLSLHL